MKILFITSSLFETGGVSRVLSVVASELTKKHIVHIVTFERGQSEKINRYCLSPLVKVNHMKQKISFIQKVLMKLNGKYRVSRIIPFEAFWERVYLSERIQKSLLQYVVDNQIDIVCGVHGAWSYYVGSLADSINCKTLGWQHNNYDAYFNIPGKYYFGRDFLFHKYCSKLDINIVLTEYDERKWKEELGVQSKTIYNPCSFVSKEKSSCTSKRFVSCGRLDEAKGFDMLIKSFAEFAEKNSDWTLDIYGEGTDHILLSNQIEQYGLQNRIHLCGNTENIREKLLESSVFLLSSRWEGMPMVVLEALECGLPIVSYDIPAVKPLVSDGKEGFVVPRFDTSAFAAAMFQISTNETQRINMGNNSSKKATHFSVEEILKQWNHILSHL